MGLEKTMKKGKNGGERHTKGGRVSAPQPGASNGAALRTSGNVALANWGKKGKNKQSRCFHWDTTKGGRSLK